MQFSDAITIEKQSICQNPQAKNRWCFEVRSPKRKNGYNPNITTLSGMRSAITQMNLEDDEKFDTELLKRLAKIVEVLQNIED